MHDPMTHCLTDAQLLDLLVLEDVAHGEHVAACEACARRLGELQETWQLLAPLADPAAPVDLTGRILASASARPIAFPWGRVAAVLLVGSVVGVTAAFGFPWPATPAPAALQPQQVVDQLGLDALGIDPEIAHSLADIPVSPRSSSEEHPI